MPFFVLRIGTLRLERLSELDSEVTSVNSNTVPAAMRIVLRVLEEGVLPGTSRASNSRSAKTPSDEFPGISHQGSKIARHQKDKAKQREEICYAQRIILAVVSPSQSTIKELGSDHMPPGFTCAGSVPCCYCANSSVAAWCRPNRYLPTPRNWEELRSLGSRYIFPL